MRTEQFLRRGTLSVALAFVAGLAAGPAMAQGELNKDADEILRSMSTFLGGTKTFSVAADISNEVISKAGEKLQLNSYATVVFQRPAGFYFHRQGRFADALEVVGPGAGLPDAGAEIVDAVLAEAASGLVDLLLVLRSTRSGDDQGASFDTRPALQR